MFDVSAKLGIICYAAIDNFSRRSNHKSDVTGMFSPLRKRFSVFYSEVPYRCILAFVFDPVISHFPKCSTCFGRTARGSPALLPVPSSIYFSGFIPTALFTSRLAVYFV